MKLSAISIFILMIMSVFSQELSNVESENVDLLESLLNSPIHIKQLQFYQLMAIPVLSFDEADHIWHWIKNRKRIEQKDFLRFLRQHNMPEDIAYLFEYDRLTLARIYSSFKMNETQFSQSEKVYLSSGKWMIRAENFGSESKSKQYFILRFQRKNTSLSIGNCGFSSYLGLLGNNNAFAISIVQPNLKLKNTQPKWLNSSLYRNPSSLAIKQILNNSVIYALIGAYRLGYYQDYDGFTMYSQPFETISTSVSRMYLKVNVLQAGIWRKINKQFALQVKVMHQFMSHPNRVNNLQSYYAAPITVLDRKLCGIGIYGIQGKNQLAVEGLGDNRGHFSGIIEYQREMMRGFRFSITNYQFSPRLYHLASGSVFSNGPVPFNQKGWSFSTALRWRTGSTSHILYGNWQYSRQLSPKSFECWADSKNKKKVGYEISKRKNTLTIEFSQYEKNENSYLKQRYLSTKIKLRYQKESEILTVLSRFYGSKLISEDNSLVNINWRKQFQRKLEMVLGSTLFSIPNGTMPAYITEYSPGYFMNFLRLSGHGISVYTSLAFKAGTSVIGMKIRETQSRSRASPPTIRNYFSLYAKILLD